jgi:UPF0716 family protein affecting phage T7 exclusion
MKLKRELTMFVQVANSLGMFMTVGCLVMVIGGVAGLVAWYINHRDALK